MSEHRDQIVVPEGGAITLEQYRRQRAADEVRDVHFVQRQPTPKRGVE